MSEKAQNFLQRAIDGWKYINDPRNLDQTTPDMKKEYIEDEFLKRRNVDNPERGVKPSLVEGALLDIDKEDFTKAGGDINIRRLKKTDIGEEAESLGLTIKPTSNESKLQRRIKRKKLENQRQSLPGLDEGLDLTSMTDEQLSESIRIATNKLQETERYGTKGSDGTRSGGSVAGNLELTQADDASKASKASVRASDESVAASKASTALNSVIAQNNQINQLNADDWNKYVYGDGKREAQIERDWQADREDAQFNANLATIKLQNAAEMERYEMMLQNDKEVRQSESISDLMSALTMLGGAFML